MKTNYKVFEKAQMVLCNHVYTWALVKYIEELKCLVPTIGSNEPVYFDNSLMYTLREDMIHNPMEFWK